MIYCFLGLLSLHNKEEGITTTEGGWHFLLLKGGCSALHLIQQFVTGGTIHNSTQKTVVTC